MSENATAVVRYTVAAAQGTFTVQAFAAGLLSGFGHDPVVDIRGYTGEVQFVAGSYADASVRIDIQSKSLAVIGDVKEKDRREIEDTMRNDVLEVQKYADITFRSTSVTVSKTSDTRAKARVVGDLTLHGVTRQGLWISAQLESTGDDIRATGGFTLKQTDYGIKLVSVAAGALKLKDELKFTFDLVGHRVSGDG